LTRGKEGNMAGAAQLWEW